MVTITLKMRNDWQSFANSCEAVGFYKIAETFRHYINLPAGTQILDGDHHDLMVVYQNWRYYLKIDNAATVIVRTADAANR